MEAETNPQATPPSGGGLGRVAVRGTAASMAASLGTLAIGGVRSIVLARLLDPRDFGLVAMGLVYYALVVQLRSFGMGAIFIGQRQRTTAWSGTWAAAQVAMAVAGGLLLAAATPALVAAYPPGEIRTSILLVFAAVSVANGLTAIQEHSLRAELRFGALAWMDLICSLSMGVVSIGLAWAGFGWWALVAEHATGVLMRCALGWTVYRAWRGRLMWDRQALQSLWRLGRENWLSTNLQHLLDQFDDFWVGTALGTAALGVYSKAYELAGYPRRIVGTPVQRVVGALFGMALDDRLRLSQLFFRASSTLLRASCLLGGLMALALPEFITYVIGNKWAPILWPFRLMIVYVALDAVLMLVGTLLQVVGRPSALRKARLVQLVAFVPGVIAGAAVWGVSGVAVAADLMLLVGGAFLVRELRPVVDLNLWRLAGRPALALAIAFGLGLWAGDLVASTWASLLVRLGVFTAVFSAILLLMEGREYRDGLLWLWELATARVARMRRAG